MRLPLLRGSWDLVRRVISTLVKVIGRYIYSVTLLITLLTKSPDPLSTGTIRAYEGPRRVSSGLRNIGAKKN